jgi:hypothetical protein
MDPNDEGFCKDADAYLAEVGGDEPPADPQRRWRLTGACACILGNETAERLAYCERAALEGPRYSLRRRSRATPLGVRAREQSRKESRSAGVEAAAERVQERAC